MIKNSHLKLKAREALRGGGVGGAGGSNLGFLPSKGRKAIHTEIKKQVFVKQMHARSGRDKGTQNGLDLQALPSFPITCGQCCLQTSLVLAALQEQVLYLHSF